MPATYSTVCSEHFQTSDVYITNKNLRRLKRTAVPVMKKGKQNTISSPSSLQEVKVSDEDLIYDSPGIAFLKRKVEKKSLEKHRLQLNNYNLIRKRKRLKETCKSLKKLVSELRKKNVSQ
ncbi:hypothetical protein evm_014658 [Chilo suppressalis]|nr:hypothetical protein evm_014658 [Chilo suppressalis]